MAQFQLGDHRTIDEVVKDICEPGYLPSFCTACYRSERTGDRFMELAKCGNIGKLCMPNALSTFKEYALDSTSEETKNASVKFIEKEVQDLDGATKRITEEMIKKVDSGEREFSFKIEKLVLHKRARKLGNQKNYLNLVPDHFPRWQIVLNSFII